MRTDFDMMTEDELANVFDACDHPKRPDGCGCADPTDKPPAPRKTRTVRQTWRFVEQSTELGFVAPYPLSERKEMT